VPLKELIEELKLKGDPVSEAALDILRCLAAFGGTIWRSELEEDIMKIKGWSLNYLPLRSEIDKAIEVLEDKGVVKVEEKTRGHVLHSGTYTDRLITAKELREIRSALVGDKVYAKYTSRVAEALRRIIEERKEN